MVTAVLLALGHLFLIQNYVKVFQIQLGIRILDYVALVVVRVVRVLVILVFFTQVDHVRRALFRVWVNGPLFGIRLIVLG